MSNSPSIIFNCQFCDPNDISEKNDFYRCKNNFNIVEYIDRLNATENLSDEDIARIRSFMEDTNATGRSIIGYADQRHGSTGVFCKDQKDNPDTIKEKLKNTDSIIWHSVLSFTPEISTKFCSNKQDAEKIIRENLPTLFQNSKIDYNNLDWFAAYHTNTENRHIHLVFWEKEPKIIDSKGNISFTKKGKLPASCFTDFKNNIIRNFTKHNHDYFSLRSEIRQDVLKILKTEKSTFDELVRRTPSILSDGHFQYNRLSKEQRKVIDDFAELIIINHPATAEKRKEYKTKLAAEHAENIKIFKDNHIKKIPQNILNFYSSRENELKERIGNALLKQLKSYALKKNQLEEKVGYVNGQWSNDSKLSIKNRKSIMSRELSRFASSVMQLFLAEASTSIDQQTLSDEEYRQKLKQEGNEVIYE